MNHTRNYKPTKTQTVKSPSYFLIRCDDAGMCHSVNMAFKIFGKRNIPFNASLMVTSGWYKEAVEILSKLPHVCLGISLILNSEWKNYKWGPVTGSLAVPSLVTKDGFFHTSKEALLSSKPDIREIEIELKAQIERALATNLDFYYIGSHMRTLESNEQLNQLMKKLAKEYEAGNIYYDVFHIGYENDELEALVDMHMLEIGINYNASEHKQAELDALCSEEFTDALRLNSTELITYKDIKQNKIPVNQLINAR